MKNEKPMSWENIPYKTWAYEPQTKMKHAVLKYYLPIWGKILGRHNEGLNYIDGFGGIGAYHTNEDIKQKQYLSKNFGSPIFSIQTIAKLKRNGAIQHANAIIIDENKKNIENLEEIVEYLGLKNINIEYIHGDFDKEINTLLDDLEAKELYPTFFLIDPFGFSIKLKTIKRIMQFDNMEVLVNFMYNAIGRHVKNPNEKINKLYDELFGTSEWRKNADIAGEEKELALVNLFRSQCKKFTKFVYPFKLNFPEKNRPYFYLFHLTNHYLGCKLMKEAFAINNNGEFEYTGKPTYESGLFDFLEEKHEYPQFRKLCPKCFIAKKQSKCKKCLLEMLNNQSITYKGFLENVVDKLPFTEREIKKMLNDFEKENIVKVNTTRKRRTGYESKDILHFSYDGEKNESKQN